MRASWAGAAAAMLISAACWAQTPSVRADPLPPLQQQWLNENSPPVQQAPAGPDATDQTQPAPTQPPPAQTERPNTWVPATTVRLQALDKVNAQTAALTIKVGGSATFGSLTITAKACVVRPTDQPADAAAYLDITDSHPDSPGFDGWMLQDEPAVSMMQHPVYDLRVVGCT